MLRHLDDNRAVLRAAVDGVPQNLRETRPAPDRWSVAEVLEHLTRVEDGLTRLLTKRLAEAHAASPFRSDAETSSVVAMIDNELLVDRSHRITAGERVIPSGELTANAAWSTLEISRGKLKELVRGYDGLDISAVVFPHPVLGPINAFQWFVFIGTHEARHAGQIREIGQTEALSAQRAPEGREQAPSTVA
jgi:hypothetical protein